MIALVGVVLIGMTGFGVFLPIFPFLALHLGGTATEATIAMGCYSLGQLIASAPGLMQPLAAFVPLGFAGVSGV